MMPVALLLFLLSLTSNAKMNCVNLKAIAEEAVAMDLAGGFTSYARKKCSYPQVGTYFRFDQDPGHPEPTKGPVVPFINFNKTKDTYKILKITPATSLYNIEVEFTIDGKIINTTYIYEPWDFLQKNSKGCGLVYNNTHRIHRTDCVEPK